MEHERETSGQIDTPSSTMAPSTMAFPHLYATLWLWGGVAIGLAAGWIATVVAVRFAPLVVFPLAVGAVLGVVLIGAAQLLQNDRRQTILAAATMAALVAVGAQHYFSYLEANREMEESQTIKDAKAAFADIMADRRPTGFFDYLRQQAAIGRRMPLGYVARGPMAWLSWAVDGLLVVAGTMAVVVFAGGPRENR